MEFREFFRTASTDSAGLRELGPAESLDATVEADRGEAEASEGDATAQTFSFCAEADGRRRLGDGKLLLRWKSGDF